MSKGEGLGEKLSEFLQRAEDVEVLDSVAWHSFSRAWSSSGRTRN